MRCVELTSATLSNNVNEIKMNTFLECSGLMGITIPKSVSKIGEGAFYECSGLTSVIIKNKGVVVGVNSFRKCSKLTSVSISDSAIIQEGAFGDTPYQSLRWKNEGLCERCGGQFSFLKKCKNCGYSVK